MEEKKCVGCGITLQSVDKNENGFLPANVLDRPGEHYCQRCFKIKNYGEYTKVKMSREDYRKEVQNEMQKADVALPVFDIIDFEGSFDDEILDVLREMDSIVIINKLDLIPDKKHPSEVASWIKARLAEEGIMPLDIAIVSSKNNYGINGIFKKIRHFYPNGCKALVLGVTNVGKSSIVNRLIGEKANTVSKFPGTTLKSVKKPIPHTNIVLIDTPGLIPEGRFSDLVCESCSQKMIPANEISRKTFKMAKDRVLMIGEMVYFRVLNDDEHKPIFSLYAAKDIKFHETNEEKFKELLGKRQDIINPPCAKCVSEYKKLEMITKEIEVNTGEELVFKGLGWLSVKRGPLNIMLTYPKDAEILIRDAFIKPKR